MSESRLWNKWFLLRPHSKVTYDCPRDLRKLPGARAPMLRRKSLSRTFFSWSLFFYLKILAELNLLFSDV
jgi:hypothetical protein